MKNFFDRFKNLNNNSFFAGMMLILLNIGSKYITVELSKSQEQYLKNSVARQLLIFAIAWMGSRDIVVALVLTGIFHVLTMYLFNEKSKFCIIPHEMRVYEDILDLNGDGVVSEEEINKAREILQKAMNKDKDKKQIQAANFFKQNV
tara:strand:+ start:2076 stop:2516 length:441 start_codon:yes stop_codon:yes gene_type:complete